MSVGETLAQARLERGLTVDDVSARTRIRATIIRAIESDSYDLCGGSFYARGHIRSIAHVVGADGDALVAEFDAAEGVPPAGPVEVPAFDPEVASRAERRRPNWAAAMVVALLVVCVVAAVQLVGRGGGKTGGGAHGGSAAGPAPTVTVTPHTSQTPVTPPSSVVAFANGVTVRVLARTDRTWLSATGSGGQSLFEGLLEVGQQRDFHDDQEIKLVIGNAPAVDLVVNGHDLGAPAAQGSVARLTSTPTDPVGAG